jgi:chromosome segregation ATPase
MPRIADEGTKPTAKDGKLAQTQTQAKEAAEKAKDSLKQGHLQRLERLTQSLQRAEERRDETIETLSNRMAALQDDGLFMHDLLRRTQQKLKAANPERLEQSEAVGNAVDALIEVFDVVAEWEIPEIAPFTPMGCLPT